MQAGLGGGSGNAATAMHAFNVLTGYPATNEQLIQWSGEIGSDISFFFSGGTAYCTGRGEIVTDIEPLPDAQDVVVHVFKPMYCHITFSNFLFSRNFLIFFLAINSLEKDFLLHLYLKILIYRY